MTTLAEKPSPNEINSDVMSKWLLGLTEEPSPKTADKQLDYEGYDGWYNNIAHPSLGSVGNIFYQLIIIC